MPIRLRDLRLIIMQVSKNFKGKKAPEDFRKIEWYFAHFCEIPESTGDEWILGKCEKFIRSGIHIAKNCKAVGQSILETLEKISRYLVITRSTGKHCMNGEYTWLSIGVYRWKGIAKAMNTSSRVISGEYLQGLHVQQTIISNKGLSGWKW